MESKFVLVLKSKISRRRRRTFKQHDDFGGLLLWCCCCCGLRGGRRSGLVGWRTRRHSSNLGLRRLMMMRQIRILGQQFETHGNVITVTFLTRPNS